MDYIPYNSRRTYHKSPFGAVQAGTDVTFRVVLPREVGCRGVRLCVYPDDGETQYVSASWDGMQGEGEEWWRIVYTPQNAGLYWYFFIYDTDFGSVSIRRADSCCGRIAQVPSRWSITSPRCVAGKIRIPSMQATSCALSSGRMTSLYPHSFALITIGSAP